MYLPLEAVLPPLAMRSKSERRHALTPSAAPCVSICAFVLVDPRASDAIRSHPLHTPLAQGPHTLVA
jgi:hypothetical protein